MLTPKLLAATAVALWTAVAVAGDDRGLPGPPRVREALPGTSQELEYDLDQKTPLKDPGEIPLKLGFLAPVRVQVFLTILRPAVVESTRIASDGTHRGRTRTPEDSRARLVAFAVLASSARMLEPESCRPNSLLHRQPCRWRANWANSRWCSRK